MFVTMFNLVEQGHKFCCNLQKAALCLILCTFTCPEAVEVSDEERAVRKVCLAMVERPHRSRFSSTEDDMADCL